MGSRGVGVNAGVLGVRGIGIGIGIGIGEGEREGEDEDEDDNCGGKVKDDDDDDDDDENDNDDKDGGDAAVGTGVPGRSMAAPPRPLSQSASSPSQAGEVAPRRLPRIRSQRSRSVGRPSPVNMVRRGDGDCR